MEPTGDAFILRSETYQDRLVVLDGICIDGSVITDYLQKLSEMDTFLGRAKGGFLYVCKREVEIDNNTYWVIGFKGVVDIVFFGRVLDRNEICIEGRIELCTGKWVVFMYHRGISGVSDEEFLGIYSLYQQVLPVLLEKSEIGLKAVSSVQVKDQ